MSPIRKTLVVVFGVFLTMPAVASAQQLYFAPNRLVASHFQSSNDITAVRVRPDATQKHRIEARTGYRLARSEYTFYVARTQGAVDGYALVDDERGRNDMITFATFFDDRGAVSRVEVVAYREPYGGAIRMRSFRQQFVGRRAHSGFRPEQDIEVIPTALESSEAACRAVHRAAVLLDEMLLDRGMERLEPSSTSPAQSHGEPWWVSMTTTPLQALPRRYSLV